MDTRTLLLELHCEEIPARFLKPLALDFQNAFSAFMDQNKLLPQNPEGRSPMVSFYSPRKLAWRVGNLLESQPDQSETQVGPPQRMCVDEAGAPTQTGLKFAEKWGVDFGAVRFEQPAGKKEPCAMVTLRKQGRPTIELLAEALPRLIASLSVPKAMRWGNSEFSFVRPIRNILCLFGSAVVPFEVDGVKTTNTTWGHRLHHLDHPEPIRITQPEAYETALEAAGIIVSFDKRRAAMAAQLTQLAAEAGGHVVADDELLDVLAEIVECPRILRGEFPVSFLELPKAVLVTSLKEHQKSFCIENATGELLPCFLTAANRPDDPEGFVKGGNEWVLKARLYDARFFFAEDRRTRLETRLEKLSHLTFHRELGSYVEKTERITRLAEQLAASQGLNVALAREAARLCKADLVTLMVGEFPELQGVMGGEYLKAEGQPQEVWRAVREHYQPLSAEGEIPSSPMGGVLAVADKLDTVAGCFAIGQTPSGSKDPLALRRAGQGIVRILWEQGWKLNLAGLVEAGLGAVKSRALKPEGETREALMAFFRDRVAYQLEVAKYSGRVRRAAMGAAWTDLQDLKARCEVLGRMEADPSFDSLKESTKRIGNILKDESPAASFDPSLLVEPSEVALHDELVYLEEVIKGAQLRSHYEMICSHLAELAQPLEAFFNAVMVKCEDPALRAARLSLLHRLRQAFLRVADFSQWQ